MNLTIEAVNPADFYKIQNPIKLSKDDFKRIWERIDNIWAFPKKIQSKGERGPSREIGPLIKYSCRLTNPYYPPI